MHMRLRNLKMFDAGADAGTGVNTGNVESTPTGENNTAENNAKQGENQKVDLNINLNQKTAETKQENEKQMIPLEDAEKLFDARLQKMKEEWKQEQAQVIEQSKKDELLKTIESNENIKSLLDSAGIDYKNASLNALKGHLALAGHKIDSVKKSNTSAPTGFSGTNPTGGYDREKNIKDIREVLKNSKGGR